jgi:hypothetical protein
MQAGSNTVESRVTCSIVELFLCVGRAIRCVHVMFMNCTRCNCLIGYRSPSKQDQHKHSYQVHPTHELRCRSEHMQRLSESRQCTTRGTTTYTEGQQRCLITLTRGENSVVRNQQEPETVKARCKDAIASLDAVRAAVCRPSEECLVVPCRYTSSMLFAAAGLHTSCEFL